MAITTFILTDTEVVVKLTGNPPLALKIGGTVNSFNLNYGGIDADGQFVYSYPGNFLDGVFILNVSYLNGSSLYAVTASLRLGVLALLRKTLKSDYDIQLMQELEAVRQFVLKSDGTSAAILYKEVLQRVTEYDVVSSIDVTGVSVQISDSNYITV